MPFRFLDLPDELRLKMYRFILPRGERIHLDPELVLFPIPYQVDDSYGDAFNLIQTCRKIHIEALQFIYKHNMVNIINTVEAKQGNFLEYLGGTACQFISKLECHVKEGLVDLGQIWETLSHCPRLTDLRLVFYHERENWSKTLAQLALYVQRNDDAEADEYSFLLDVELHTSIWAYHYTERQYGEQFQKHWKRATRLEQVYTIDNFPSQLRHITIAASVNHTAAPGFAQWIDEGDEEGEWSFCSAGRTDTDMKKTMRFVRSERV